MKYEFSNIEYEKDIEPLEKEIEIIEVLPVKNETIPKFTVVCLIILCTLSFATGVWYWYTTYYIESDVIIIVDAGGEYIIETTSEPEETQEPEPTYHEEPVINLPTRPILNIRPEFVQMRQENNNDNIIGRLFIENELDVFVLQVEDIDLSETESVFFDNRLDVWFDFELNIIIHGNHESVLQSILHEYFEYDFFLMNPIVYFNTIYADYMFEIFSFYVAPKDFVHIQYNETEWGETIEFFRELGFYNTMLDVTEFDQVLTITTPTSTNQELYYVLQARLYREITS